MNKHHGRCGMCCTHLMMSNIRSGGVMLSDDYGICYMCLSKKCERYKPWPLTIENIKGYWAFQDWISTIMSPLTDDELYACLRKFIVYSY